MINKNSRIGIWGFGVVGKAAFRFFHSQGIKNIALLDKNKLTAENSAIVEKYGINFFQQTNPQTIQLFLEQCDYLIISPGIDISQWNLTLPTLLTEIDLFFNYYKGPIIAITGTVGKTTITTLLGSLLHREGEGANSGGNIGLGMLDLLIDGASSRMILELSSFQLEHSTSFAPQIAIITNLYPNHLDRHETMEEYIKAKSKIFTQQQPTDHLIIDYEAYNLVKELGISIPSKIHLIYSSQSVPDKIMSTETAWYVNADGTIVRNRNEEETIIFNAKELPAVTYESNWLFVIATLQILQEIHLLNQLNKRVDSLLTHPALSTSSFKDHRLEKIATINDIDIYNDSKATVMQATVAAVTKLSGCPLVLLLGGLSKGVDRTPLIEKLKGKVESIICFGSEAELLSQACREHQIAATICSNLDEAYSQAMKRALPGSQILFSPGGASFDLFANYQDRGDYFKRLVKRISQTV